MLLKSLLQTRALLSARQNIGASAVLPQLSQPWFTNPSPLQSSQLIQLSTRSFSRLMGNTKKTATSRYQVTSRLDFDRDGKLLIYHSENGDKYLQWIVRINMAFIVCNGCLLVAEIVSPCKFLALSDSFLLS